MIIGGMVVDVIGMKKLLLVAFFFHLAGILLTVFAGGYWTLFLSTLLIGIANGTVEAACNPLVSSLFPDNKTTKLNHFHLWFPGGIVIGTLIVWGLNKLGVSWQVEVSLMLIPTLVYGYLFSRLQFPVTERVAAGVSTGEMYKALFNPLYLFMIICMFGTAITELFTAQWVDVLLKNVTDNALLILTLDTGVMVVGRAFAGPRGSPAGATGCIIDIGYTGFTGSLYAWTFNGQYDLFGGACIWHRRLLFLAHDAGFCFGKPAADRRRGTQFYGRSRDAGRIAVPDFYGRPL